MSQFATLVNRNDQLGANFTSMIAQLAWMQAAGRQPICPRSLRFVFGETSRELFRPFRYMFSSEQEQQDLEQKENSNKNNGFDHDWLLTNSRAAIGSGTNLVSWFRRHAYPIFWKHYSTSDFFAAMQAKYRTNNKNNTASLRLCVHLRLGDVQTYSDASYHESAIETWERLAQGSPQRLSDFQNAGSACQARIHEKALAALLDQIHQRYVMTHAGRQIETFLVCAPGEVAPQLASALPFPLFQPQNEDEALFLMATADVLIASRSTFALSAVYLFQGERVCLPTWAHHAATGLGVFPNLEPLPFAVDWFDDVSFFNAKHANPLVKWYHSQTPLNLNQSQLLGQTQHKKQDEDMRSCSHHAKTMTFNRARQLMQAKKKVTFALPDASGCPLDLKLMAWFRGETDGTFVEAGANDGLDQSNTKLLEDVLGWRGILVEPSPAAFARLEKNRPLASTFQTALVSDTFRLSSSRLKGDFADGHLMASVDGKRRNNIQTNDLISVQATTLDSILLSNASKFSKPVDLLSLDVEGYERQVLSGFRSQNPRVILVETYVTEEQQLKRDLAQRGYVFVGNFSAYNRTECPQWDGTHNDLLFEWHCTGRSQEEKTYKETESGQQKIERKGIDGKEIKMTPNQGVASSKRWQPENKMKYPAYLDGKLFEGWFSEFYHTHRDWFPPNAVYLDIGWTALYCNSMFCNTPFDHAALQSFVDQTVMTSRRRDPKCVFFTVVQFDDGVHSIRLPEKTLVFSSGGRGQTTRLNPTAVIVGLPLLYEDRQNRLETQRRKHNQVNKKVLCSFVGRPTHRVREIMFRCLLGRTQEESKATLPVVLIDSGAVDQMERFTELGFDSFFMLCPRGYGESSFRTLEALQLGCVPVYVHDDKEPWRPMEEYLLGGRSSRQETPFDYDLCVSIDQLPQLASILQKLLVERPDRYRLLWQNGQNYLANEFTYAGCAKHIRRTLRQACSLMNLTVAIPTFDRWNTFLRPTVTSLLTSHCIDEIVIMDDASGDRLALSNWLATEFRPSSVLCPTIRVFSQQTNQGASKNKISAVSFARNARVFLLDSDNSIDPELLGDTRLLSLSHVEPKIVVSPIKGLPKLDYSSPRIPMERLSFAHLGPNPVINSYFNLGNYIVDRRVYLNAAHVMLGTGIHPGPYDAFWLNYHMTRDFGVELWKHPDFEYTHAVHSGSLWGQTHKPFEAWYDKQLTLAPKERPSPWGSNGLLSVDASLCTLAWLGQDQTKNVIPVFAAARSAPQLLSFEQVRSGRQRENEKETEEMAKDEKKKEQNGSKKDSKKDKTEDDQKNFSFLHVASQSGQDLFAMVAFASCSQKTENQQSEGATSAGSESKEIQPFYIDIGAGNGETRSNTLLLSTLGWHGICVEHDPTLFEQLASSRDAHTTVCRRLLIADKCGFATVSSNGQIESISDQRTHTNQVPCTTVKSLLKQVLGQCESRHTVHFLSIDTDGSELQVLQGFPFDEVRVMAMCIEHDAYQGCSLKKTRVFQFLSKLGYERVVEDHAHGGNAYEDWYVHPSIRDSIDWTLFAVHLSMYFPKSQGHPRITVPIEKNDVLSNY